MTLEEQIGMFGQVENASTSRNDFIEAYIPFIISRTSKVTNQYIDGMSDERFIVALEAFNEAIDRFDPEKGKFLAYAELIIRSRVTDWMRGEHLQNDRYELRDFIEIESSTSIEEKYLLKEEVFACKKKLAGFGITFDDLVDKAPQKEKTARKVTDIGRRSSEDNQIVGSLYTTMKLPMKVISEKFKVTKRILKSHRDFIITVIVIIKEDYRQIGEFLLKAEER